MISVIICSRTKAINKSFSENIKKTIGCEFELIVIDNSENKYSIFEAYNLGIEKSTFDYLCLIHDDILFHTNEWGIKINHFFKEDQSLGLIGIAGAKSKTKLPSLWWLCPKEDKITYLIQHIPNQDSEIWNSGFEKEDNVEVVAVDGVFMAMRKDPKIFFNKEMVGFHNYDLNISVEYKKHCYKVIATKDILIEHFSLGTIKEEWVESSYRFYNLYKRYLPLNDKDNKRNKKQEISNAIWFINESLRFKKYKIAFSIWRRLFYLDPFLKYHLIFWKRLIKST
ncbi:glycosyltransferase [Flavobacterium hercynium]|uniref:Streptomycin biosynthesis protein StrF domain-containing protein n=1 Tax=Flavobacterium hercynium TaxID=387094 RepID=A0A226HCZ8_9FLAO|nr:glycosyltransferase [Flavobacterium hercynium]OXA92209.1 hypothetical protein B0A66_10635 [Flavobacterium hercynium]SMP24304.1 Glycosyltransferase like family protein [Flavobacterium hercynium]